MSSSTTTNHETIRHWAEARRGHPARVRTEGEGGILRIDFGRPEDNLERIDWDAFFEIFDERSLAFLYQDETADGEKSRFNKFITREKGS